jgi:glycosyltransferase involved in cell wall biosynthesis
MVRVCVVAPKHIIGGQAISAQALLAGFASDEEFRLELVAIDPPLPRWIARLRGVRTVARLPTYLASLVRAFRRADVVHVYTAAFWPFALSTTPAILLARAMGRPVLLNYHDGRAAEHIRTGWVRWVLRRATILVFPSRFLQHRFRSVGLSGQVIPNVVDAEQFRFRERVALRPVLLSCRLLERLYSVDNTIRAFALVRARRPDARLIVLGGGDQQERLRALALQLGVEGIELCGAVPHVDVPTWFDRADVWVNSSREDNMPLSVIEAFSSGLPVVTTRAGGIPSMVQHERTGLLVDIDDPQALADAIVRLLDDTALASRLAAEGRRVCLERYVWSAVHEKWRAVFTDLAARPVTVPASAMDVSLQVAADAGAAATVLNPTLGE